MRLSHKGNAKVTTITAALGDTGADLTIPIADPSGWPDGSGGPFYVSINKGLQNEEKILCSALSGNILQVWTSGPDSGRGADDTAIQTHAINSPIEHVWTAIEANQANAHAEETEGAHGYPPSTDIMTLSGDQEATGTKTFRGAILNDPVITDGAVNEASYITLAAGQTLDSFRARNIYIGDGPPSKFAGNDGDLYIQKAP